MADPPPLTTEDRAQIVELLARYNHAVDSGQVSDYVGTFVEAGVFEIGDVMTFEGPQELGSVVTDPARVCGQHVSTNIVIEPAGPGRALVHSYAQMLALAGDPPAPTVTAFGRFTDDVVQLEGSWRFERRRYRPGL